MPDQYADLIAGTVLAQELLVRHLEEQGVLEKGTFRSVLEEHLGRCEPCGKEAVLKAVEIQPDIAVLADTLPLADGIDGIEATRQIHARLPKTKVLVFATHDNETLIEELLNAGARGYVRKSDAKRSLLGAIAALAANKRFSAPTVFLANGDRPQSLLTKRERVVIQLVAEGYSSKKIAKLLNITRRTVDTHRFNIRSKLNLFKIADLVRYAVRNKIVER